MRTRRAHGRQGRRLAAVVVSVMLLLAAGCASTPPAPGHAVPELRGTLTRVDQAIVDHRPRQARHQLRQLIRTTVDARDAGRLDSAQADAVLAAAAGLLSDLPRARPEPPPAPEPEPTPEPTAPEPDDHKDQEHKEPKEPKEPKEHGHGHAYGHQDEGHGDHDEDSDEDD